MKTKHCFFFSCRIQNSTASTRYRIILTVTSTRSFEAANWFVFFLSSAAGPALIGGYVKNSVGAFLLIKEIENVVTIGKWLRIIS